MGTTDFQRIVVWKKRGENKRRLRLFAQTCLLHLPMQWLSTCLRLTWHMESTPYMLYVTISLTDENQQHLLFEMAEHAVGFYWVYLSRGY